ncbi:MAG: PASTA domain-containing protein [Gemmatimonadetes bacterium]|nr:PASTA domain-containing protein [Gemmatimonadota bacterium]
MTALLLIGFGLGYLITAVLLFPSQSVARGLVRVPDLVGLQAEEARERLERARLGYEEAPGLSHSRPAGTVVAQEPLAGQMARPGAAVDVFLSQGPRERPVPDIIGLAQSQAEIVLSHAGFSSQVIWVDAEADVGQVVGMQPAPGTPAAPSSEVRLIVSAGPRTVNVPDLSGRSLEEARTALERLGLRLGEVTELPDSLAAPGTVRGQSPRPGSVLDRGSAVGVAIAVTPPPEDLDTAAVDSLRPPPDTAPTPPDSGTTVPSGNRSSGDGRR